MFWVSSLGVKAKMQAQKIGNEPSGDMMRKKSAICFALILIMLGLALPNRMVAAQERLKIAYSSADASNTVWFTALDAGLYRKYGLDAELIFIQSSTMSVSTVSTVIGCAC